jgi:hypothetical protein
VAHRSQPHGYEESTEYEGAWQQVDGLRDGGMYYRGHGVHYMRPDTSNVLRRCTATDNIIPTMNLRAALGYQVTVTATDPAGFPTDASAMMEVPVSLAKFASRRLPVPRTVGPGPTDSGVAPTFGAFGVVARIVQQYESMEDRVRRSRGLFNPVTLVLGIRTNGCHSTRVPCGPNNRV